MRIVIIGGSGFIGQNLAAELISAGHSVTITTRKAAGSANQQYKWEQWDGKDSSRLAEILTGCDAVVNLAGENIGAKLWTKARKEVIYGSRIPITRSIVDAIGKCKQKPGVIIQASAIGYYGIGDETRDESSPNGKDWLAGLSQAWEDAIKDLKGDAIRKVNIRSGVVLGKGEGVLERLILPFKLFVGGPIGGGKQWISWIHIKDEVRAIRYLLEHTECKGIYNLAALVPVTNAQMGKALANQIKRPYWFPLPGFALRIVLGEMSTLVVDGQKVLPKRLSEAGFKFNFETVDTALTDLLS
jgi:uncharacterized protein